MNMKQNRRLALMLIIGLLMLSLPTLAQDNALPTAIGLELVADNLTAPVDLNSPSDGSGRLFVADQTGQIYIVSSDGQMLDEPFLDISDRMVTLNEGYDERGLLGLAFHPDYANNGRFFVYYSAPLSADAPDDWNHTSHISEFTVSDDNPDQANPDSERVLLTIDQPQMNHNGGDITFGPDGYFYIPLGDGGAANDVGPGHTEGIGNAQDLSNLLGSILRIDVDNGDPYAIPEDNPFVGDDSVADEIWAWGFRNPWRISFDTAGSNQLFVADAGQNLWEEVSIVESGNNYGWNIMEGTHCFDPTNPDASPEDCEMMGENGNELQLPVIEYSHDLGLVVVGGFVYRGSLLPEAFQGQYIFADWSTAFDQTDGKILIANVPADGADSGTWDVQTLEVAMPDGGEFNQFILAFGRDANNELYVLTSETPGPTGNTGKVWRLVDAANNQS